MDLLETIQVAWQRFVRKLGLGRAAEEGARGYPDPHSMDLGLGPREWAAAVMDEAGDVVAVEEATELYRRGDFDPTKVDVARLERALRDPPRVMNAPATNEAWIFLGTCMATSKERVEVFRHVAEGTPIPRFRSEGLCRWADALLNESDTPSRKSLDKAAELIEEALSLDDSYSLVHETAGSLHRLEYRCEKAITELDMAIELRSLETGPAFVELGLCHEALGHDQRAAECYGRGGGVGYPAEFRARYLAEYRRRQAGE